jgi:uncharacterized membrane protein
MDGSFMSNPYSLTPVKAHDVGRLFVLAFPDEFTAFSLRETLWKMEDDNIIDVGDAVVVTRDTHGRVRLHQSLPLAAAASAFGSVSGMVLGMMVLNPLFGSVAGAVVGAAAGAWADVGIDDNFMEELGETLKPGTSALFVAVRHTKPDLVLEPLKPFSGSCRILQCDMPADKEPLLRRLLEGEAARVSADAGKSPETRT